jgi:hypothetical protein
MQTYTTVSAWRELLARIFSGFSEQDNVSPPWLVNPSTHRRLKLDKFYPEIALAIRFVGLTARGQGRKSDLEELENEERERVRAELCRTHGVHLATFDPAEELVKQVDGLLSVMARASRSLAQSERPDPEKARWMPALARPRCSPGRPAQPPRRPCHRSVVGVDPRRTAAPRPVRRRRGHPNRRQWPRGNGDRFVRRRPGTHLPSQPAGRKNRSPALLNGYNSAAGSAARRG